MRKTSALSISICVGIILFLANACGTPKSATTECGTSIPTYNGQVSAIINDACGSSCHSNKYKAGGIELSSYATIKAESAKPRFLGAIRHLAGFDPMPKKAPMLSDSVIKIISCWAKNGTPE